jgi:hypothetical protein
MDENNKQDPVSITPASSQTTPEVTAQVPVVSQELSGDTDVVVPNTNNIDIFAGNKKKRAIATRIVFGIVAIGVVTILLLTSAGLASSSYGYVSQLNNYSSVVVWIIALSTGILAAYLTAHPSNFGEAYAPSGGKTIGIIALVLIGLVMGLIPGIIILGLYLLLRHRRNSEASTGQIASKPVRVILVILSFILGFVPGLIVAFMLNYPLSKHACELSGSKYC